MVSILQELLQQEQQMQMQMQKLQQDSSYLLKRVLQMVTMVMYSAQMVQLLLAQLHLHLLSSQVLDRSLQVTRYQSQATHSM
mgnify:CR=1 FL=1